MADASDSRPSSTIERERDGSACGTVGVGDAAPDFDLRRAGGAAHWLSDLHGAPVVLVFHSSEWNPARAELVEAYNAAIRGHGAGSGTAGATLLSIDGDETWRELTFGDATIAVPIVRSIPQRVARDYGVSDVSAVFVLDETGTIRWRSVAHPGGMVDPDALAAALGALTADDATPRAPAVERTTWSRRDFVAAAVGAACFALLAPRIARASTLTRAAPVAPRTLRINGRDVELPDDARVTLLDLLRDRAKLTGTKKGCDHGQCGACTVHVDGRRVLSCLSLAAMQVGKEITTIEGLASAGAADGDASQDTASLHPMQRAFIEHDGFQCGYCTSGQIMSAVAVLKEPWGASDDDVREAMSGNICRCGAYPGILAAVQSLRHGGASSHPTPPRR